MFVAAAHASVSSWKGIVFKSTRQYADHIAQKSPILHQAHAYDLPQRPRALLRHIGLCAHTLFDGCKASDWCHLRQPLALGESNRSTLKVKRAHFDCMHARVHLKLEALIH